VLTATRVRRPFLGGMVHSGPLIKTRPVPRVVIGTTRVEWRFRPFPVLVLPAPPPKVILPVVVGPWTPTFNLRASLATTFSLRAAQATTFSLLAAPRVVFNLGAGTMSISSNLVFYRGEDITLNFQMTPVVDITGWTINFKMAQGLAGAIMIALAATIVDGPRGRFQVTIANGNTASIAVGRYVWDCRREDGGYRATLADGYLDLRQEVTT
jgi:hypothetical protein